MEGSALDIFHGDVNHAVLLAGVIDGYDIGMAEHPGGAGLILEAAQNILGFQAMNVHAHGFQRNGASNGGIQRLVNHTHGTAAQLRDDLVSTDSLQRHDRHDSFPSCDFIEPAWTLKLWGRLKKCNSGLNRSLSFRTQMP